MGRSTVQQLIQRAQNMNSYNNNGIETQNAWIDFFNDALQSMVDDLDIHEETTLVFNPSQKQYDLPDDYYALRIIEDTIRKETLVQKRNYNQRYPYGYWVIDKGSKHVIDITYDNATTFNLYYQRYPEQLTLAQIDTQKPEVPTIGETALCYKAIYYACLNNNQIEQATYFDDLYKRERANIKTASVRARGV